MLSTLPRSLSSLDLTFSPTALSHDIISDTANSFNNSQHIIYQLRYDARQLAPSHIKTHRRLEHEIFTHHDFYTEGYSLLYLHETSGDLNRSAKASLDKRVSGEYRPDILESFSQCHDTGVACSGNLSLADLFTLL